MCTGKGLGVVGIKPWDYTSAFIISSHTLEARWWTMTSAFGRHRQTDRFMVGRDGEKEKRKEKRRKNERTNERKHFTI